MRPFLEVADLIDGRFAVLSIDPTMRVGDGCGGIVMSIHETREQAERARDYPSSLNEGDVVG